MFTSLKGRSVIVTGAGKGIGRGIALRFGAAGCQLLLVARTLADAESVAAEIQPTAAPRAHSPPTCATPRLPGRWRRQPSMPTAGSTCFAPTPASFRPRDSTP